MSTRKIQKSQDGSAYWHFVTNGSSQNIEGNFPESVEANPDQLSEDDVLIQKSELSEEQEEQVSAYYRAVSRGILRKLAPRQREIWKLRFFKWCSEEEIVEKLGISLSAVRSHLARAGVKIREEIERQKRKKEMLDGDYFKAGFKKKIKTRGETNTDKEFGDRLERGQKEIDAFCRKHPELRRDL